LNRYRAGTRSRCYAINLSIPAKADVWALSFLTPEEALPAINEAGRFYLWEGGFIGEATVVASGD
jgi:hypothetical protein